jgi:Tol biopolymer transport system component
MSKFNVKPSHGRRVLAHLFGGALITVICAVAAVSLSSRHSKLETIRHEQVPGAVVERLLVSPDVDMKYKPSARSEADALPFGIAKLCFNRGSYIYLKTAGTDREERLVRGWRPSLSPDGETIVFVDMGHRSVTDSATRTIKTLDLRTRRVKSFQGTAGFKPMSPIWSHGGKSVAFEATASKERGVGILKIETGEVLFLTPAVKGELGPVLSSWTEDDSAVVCQDQENLYKISLDGSVFSTTPMATFVKDNDFSPSDRFLFSQDGRYLLFNNLTNPDQNYSLFIYDGERGELTKITHDNIDAMMGQWLPLKDHVLFVRRAPTKRSTDVCVVSMNDGAVTTIVKEATNPSFSSK